MRLYHSSTSPFVRKVLIAAHEAGIADRLDLVSVAVTPVARNPEVGGQNPLGKVPTLVLDDGTALFDSRVIVEHIDLAHGGGRLIPVEPRARIRALTGQALGDGLMEAAILIRYETALRPEALRWPEWIAGHFVKIDASLDAMEKAVGAFDGRFAVDAVAFAAALGYLDFRYADRPWREGRPGLEAWFAEVSKRPSVAATMPKA